MDFAASPNSEGSGKGDQVFIDGASVWYKHSDAFRVDLGQKKVPFGLEETSSSSKIKAIERSAVNRQFAEQLKFNARHTGLFAKGSFDGGFSYAAAVVNSGQNHNSKDVNLKAVSMVMTQTNYLTTDSLHMQTTMETSPIALVLQLV